MILIFYTFYTLSLWIIKKYFVDSFLVIIINYQRLHTLSINKTLWSFAFKTFITFVTNIWFVTFPDIVLSFIWKVVICSYLFWRCVKLLFFIKLNFINIFHIVFNVFCILSIVRHVFYRLFFLIYLNEGLIFILSNLLFVHFIEFKLL